jgi:hypothetical protein
VYDGEGRVLVTARVASVGSPSIAAVEATGAVVTVADDARRSITMKIAPAALQALAAVPGVEYVGEELAPMTNATCPTGVVSEGDSRLNAATARSTFGVDGTGVTVGVLSDSFNFKGGAPTDVSAAELPGTTNPCGYTTPVSVLQDDGSGDEGRAMAQIVHDLAPAAAVAFATANGGEAAFAANITALANAGAKVIVDDITYLAEPMYQDGVVADAVTRARAAGVSYFSSAGNENMVVNGENVSSYEVPLGYRAAPCPAGVPAYELDCHDFDAGPGTDVTDSLIFGASSTLTVVMGWNEPQYGIGTDLDLFLLDAAGTVVADSIDDNPGGSQRAFEEFTAAVGAGEYRLVIGRFAGGTPRFKFIMMRPPNLTQVEWTPSDTSDVIGPTIFGHNAAMAASAVAAVPYSDASSVEPYSSRGPATYCWGPVAGTTPAPPLPACQSKQVDIAATDGVRNSFFGGAGPPFRFFGTSAAAPHAAAVAALQLDRAPGTTPAQVIAAQAGSARAVDSFGPGAVGAGLIDAAAAVAAHNAMSAQTISWTTPPPGTIVVGTSFPVAARATSGLPVTITTSGPCTSGGLGSATITATSAGSCTVRADQAGNSQWLPAPQIAALVPVVPAVVAAPVGYVPTSPARLLDSRPGATTVDAQAAGIGVRPASSTTALQVTGRAGVPADASAAVINVTVTEPEGPGFVTVWPCGEPQPLASNLNYTAGANVPNNVVVKIGAGGKVCLYTLGATHLIADLNGWIPTS